MKKILVDVSTKLILELRNYQYFNYAQPESGQAEYPYDYGNIVLNNDYYYVDGGITTVAPPELPLTQEEIERLKLIKDSEFRETTRIEIISGFDYDVSNETYHFSYDTEDQSNFFAAGIRATFATLQQDNLYTQEWRGWQNGIPTILNFSLEEFVALATYGYEVFKQLQHRYWQAQQALIAAQTKEEIEAVEL